MTCEPLDLKALSRVSLGLGKQWTADIDNPGEPDEQWTGEWETYGHRGTEGSWRPGDCDAETECAIARGVAEAVTALPRLLGRVRDDAATIATLTAERDAARAEVLRLDQALTAVRVALGAAGIPDVEPYPDEPVDDRARSLRAGGRVIAMQDRIGRLTAERDAAVRELADARRSGLTLTAEERAAVAFALGCLDAKREEEHGRFRRTHLLAEADTHSKSIRNLLAGARTVTESTAPTVADALRDDAAARGGA